MGRKIEVKLYCQSGEGASMAVFEEQRPKEWYWVEAKMIPKTPAQKPSFLEKLGLMKGPSQPQYQPQSNDAMSKVEGAFYTGTMKCPYCGNGSFVKCGACGELTCFPLNGKHFKCIPCGNSGEVSGTISDMSGSNVDDYGSRDDSSLSRRTQPRQNGPTLR